MVKKMKEEEIEGLDECHDDSNANAESSDIS